MSSCEDCSEQDLGSSAPAWVEQVIDIYRPATSNFEDRAREAVAIGVALASLRRERDRLGFAPVPFSEYMNELAQSSSMSSQILSRIHRWFGIRSFENVEKADSVARLAHAIGLSLRETLVMVRLQIARHMGFAASMVAARRSPGSGRSDLVAECEMLLRQWEAKYPTDRFLEMERLEMAIRASYDSHPDEQALTAEG